MRRGELRDIFTRSEDSPFDEQCGRERWGRFAERLLLQSHGYLLSDTQGGSREVEKSFHET